MEGSVSFALTKHYRSELRRGKLRRHPARFLLNSKASPDEEVCVRNALDAPIYFCLNYCQKSIDKRIMSKSNSLQLTALFTESLPKSHPLINDFNKNKKRLPFSVGVEGLRDLQ